MSQAQILWHIVVAPALHPDRVVGHFLMTWSPLQLRVEGAPVVAGNHSALCVRCGQTLEDESREGGGLIFAIAYVLVCPVHDQHGACDTANFLVAPKNIHRV